MTLEIYMVGLIVEDMRKSVEFYRQLGLEIPEGSEAKPFVEIKMTGMSLFLCTQPALWDPHYSGRAEQGGSATAGSYTHLLEFNLKEHSAVDAMHAKLTSLGYQSYLEPYQTSFDAHFALVYDPDGNMILLSA